MAGMDLKDIEHTGTVMAAIVILNYMAGLVGFSVYSFADITNTGEGLLYAVVIITFAVVLVKAVFKKLR